MKKKMQMQGWKKKIISFLVSQMITLFGSSIVQMAMIWYVTLETSSGIWVTTLTLCSFLPQLVISFFSGVWADRYSRKNLIILADAVIALATLGLVIFLVIDHVGENTLPAILFISVIRSLGAGVQTPAVNALIPQLVPEERLMKVNSIHGSMMSMVQFAAPAVAGAILAFGKLEHILFIDIFTAVVGITMLLFLSIPKLKIKTSKQQPSFFAEMKAGIQYCITNKFVGKMLLSYSAFIFLCVPSGFLIPLMIERTFGDNVWYFSINEMVGFAGMVLGGIVLGMWGGFKNRVKTYALGMLAYGLFAILLGFSTHFIFFVSILFFVSFFIPVVQTSVMTLLQEKTTLEMQGRVFSLLNVLFSGFMPLGMIVFGPLGDFLPLQFLMIGSGSIIVFIGSMIRCKQSFYKAGEMSVKKEQEANTQNQ